MKKFTLKNDFHNTEVTVHARRHPDSQDDVYTLSKRQTARVIKELCGINDCCCGDIRGPQGGLDVYPVWSKKEESEVLEIEIMEENEG